MAERAKRDFLRFRDRGDSKALARVFDTLAPRLLLIAAHVLPDRALAEDVVQETFLRVMREAHRYDRSQPLFPWLVGILQNEARMARRAERRVPDPARLPPSDGSDPAEEAASRDLIALFLHRVETLPKTYRDVLNLRLAHSLTAVEIAHALGRPPATVHTQLRRGMNLLRKALPVGLALPTLMSLRDRGLSQVRQVVLEQAAGSTTSGVGTGFASVLPLGKIMIPVSLLAGLGYLAAGQLPADTIGVSPGMESATEAPKVPAADRLVAYAEAEAPTESPSEEPVREKVEPGVADGSTAFQELAYIRGRCVAAETGLPLAGCTVTVRGSAEGSAARYGEVEWEAPDPVITGADGRFEISFAATRSFRHSMEIHRDHRAPRTAQWSSFEPDQVEDLGDISLEPGYEVSGQVVDPLGDPVEGVRVVVEDVPSYLNLGNVVSYAGSSDSQGRFSVRVPIPAGAWVIRATGRGCRHLSPRSVIVQKQFGASPLHVVVQPMPSISGTVVDESGLSAAGVQITGLPESPGTPPSTQAGENGDFTLYSTREGQAGMRLRVGGGLGRGSAPYEAFEDGRIYEWGSTGVQLVAKRALSVELRVVEEGTGEPVEDYGVVCHSLSVALNTLDPRLASHHPEGRLTLKDVLRGRNRLVVFPRDPALMPSAAIEFDALEPRVAPIVVELERMRRHPVRVITEEGKPVASSSVELIRKGSGDFDVDSPVQRPREGRTFWTFGWVAAEVLSHGRTDSAGQVALPVPFDATDLVLRVSGKHHLPKVVRNVRFPGDGTAMDVAVSPSASLSGTVLLDGFEPKDVFVILRHPDGSQVRSRPEGGRIKIKPDGTFLQEEMDPGEYSLSLAVYGHQRDLEELQRIGLRGGESVDVELDGTRYKPSTLRGRIFLDGMPLSDGRVLLQGPGLDVPIALNTEGRFVADRLKAYRYGVEILVGEHNPTTGILFDELVDLEPGGEVERDFHFAWQRMRIRLLTVDRAPLRESRVEMRLGRTLDSKSTDGDGWIVLDPVRSSPVSIHLDNRVLGPLEVPVGQKEATFELQIGK